jgi:hypothetical protein
MMKKVAILSSGVLLLSLSFVAASASEAKAAATCFCKISKDNLTNSASATGVLKDLTSQVNMNFTGINQQSASNQKQCSDRCTNVAQSYSGQQSIATLACQAGAPNGTPIKAYAAVGTRKYDSAQFIGELKNIAAVTQQVCPAGSLANPTNVDGGVTSDGKCKKLVSTCPMNPTPPNGTQIGTWGFTWGSGVFQWIQPNTTVTSQAQCKF